MIETETRPLTDAERLLLPSGPTLPVRWTAGIGPGLALAVLAFLVGLLVLGFAGWTSRAAVYVLLIVTLLIALGGYGHVTARTRRMGPGPTPWDDVLDGTARVDRFAITDAIAVEESEDEGLSYFLALADGRVLFLSGQYLYEPVERGEFPARRFEVVRTSRTGTVLSVTALDPPLAPGYSRPPLTVAELEGEMPGDGAILPGPLEAYRS